MRNATYQIKANAITVQDAKAAMGTSEEVLRGLILCLADTYTLAALTQNAHWNIEGDEFFQFHAAFGDQYGDLAAAVDEIAEHLRQLHAYAPVSLAAFESMSGIAQPVPPLPQEAWLTALVNGHSKTVADLTALQVAAGTANDLETQDLTIARIRAHTKVLWMLRASLAETEED